MLEILVKKDGITLLSKNMAFNSIDIEAVNSLYPIGQIVINAKKDLLTIDYFDDNKSLLRRIKSTNYFGANINYDDFKLDNVDMLNHIIELSMISEDRIINALFVGSYYYEYHLMKYFYGDAINSNGLNELLSETYVYDYIPTANFLITIEHVYGEILQEIFIKNKLSTNPIDNDIKIYSDGMVEINNSNLYYFKDNNNVKKDEEVKIENDNKCLYKLSIFVCDKYSKIFEIHGEDYNKTYNKYTDDLDKLINKMKFYNNEDVYNNKDSCLFYTITQKTYGPEYPRIEDKCKIEVILSGKITEDEIEKVERLKIKESLK